MRFGIRGMWKEWRISAKFRISWVSGREAASYLHVLEMLNKREKKS